MGYDDYDDCDDFDWKDPIERERILKKRLEAIKERQEYIKKRNRSYLKGQYGKRRYFDKDKVGDIFFDLDDEEDTGLDDLPVKCVFTKNLRREKLFQYLKYLEGRKVLVRDLAWKFAVTERTIQSDLRWLENNGFIERHVNKIRGKQTKNSFVVNASKENDLPCKDNYLEVVFLAKADGYHYVLTKTKYSGRDKKYSSPQHKTIDKYDFALPQQKQRYDNKLLDGNSFQIAENIFGSELQEHYKGQIYTDLYKHYSYKFGRFGGKNVTFTKRKTYFTLFVLDDMFSAPKGYFWLKLSVAPRRLKSKSCNKCLKYIQDKLLG